MASRSRTATTVRVWSPIYSRMEVAFATLARATNLTAFRPTRHDDDMDRPRRSIHTTIRAAIVPVALIAPMARPAQAPHRIVAMRLRAVAVLLVWLFVSIPVRAAFALPAAFETYDLKSSKALDRSTTLRRQVAERFDTVVVKGVARTSTLTEMRAANPSIQLINYEQSFALNNTEATYARSQGWLATTCEGSEIHPRDIPSATLLDATNAQALEWRSSAIADETAALSYDGVYLDTLGSHYNESFYDGTPCGISDGQWRDASIGFVNLVKSKTGGFVIMNGAGFQTGKDYYNHKSDADMLMASDGDAVHIEHFNRGANQSISQWRPEGEWEKDIRFLQAIGSANKEAFAFTKIDVAMTTKQLTRARDYALGSFLLGAKGGAASFGFNPINAENELGFAPDNGWIDQVGAPAGDVRGGTSEVRVRSFVGGEIAVNPTRSQLVYRDVTMRHHLAKAFPLL